MMGLLAVVVHNSLYLLFACLLAVILSILAYCIYQCFFHPFSRYPGPLVAKFSPIYAAYHAWKGDIHTDLYNCHAKYGDYVRYSPNSISINNAIAMREIYREGKNYTKPRQYRMLRHQAANMFTMINKKEHARRRRIIGPLVSDTAVRRFESTMLHQIRKFFSLLTAETKGTEWTGPKNMANWFDYMVFDIMGRVIFGVEYNLLERKDHRHVFEAIETSNRRMSVLLYWPFLRSVARIDRFLFPKAIEARDIFIGFIAKIVEDCMRKSSNKSTDTDSNDSRSNFPFGEPIRTLFSTLSQSKDSITGEGSFSLKEIIAETTNLCAASVDTTATALSATCFYLCRNPHAYQRAAAEVRAAFASLDDIRLATDNESGTSSGLTSCVYLRACIDEALRLAPPAPAALFREVADDGAFVQGAYFPPGVLVGVPVYSIHHNEEYFPEPFRYMPERWLSHRPETGKSSGLEDESVQRAQSAYMPFSHGSRGCIGKQLAMHELMLTMAVALFTLDFRLDVGDQSSTPGMPDEFHLNDFITACSQGPVLNFRPRQSEVLA